jgi:hypothetical protein
MCFSVCIFINVNNDAMMIEYYREKRLNPNTDVVLKHKHGYVLYGLEYIKLKELGLLPDGYPRGTITPIKLSALKSIFPKLVIAKTKQRIKQYAIVHKQHESHVIAENEQQALFLFYCREENANLKGVINITLEYD